MGITRIYRRLKEKRGEAVRKKYFKLKDRELKKLPAHLIKKANLTNNFRWNVTEWKEV